MKKGFTLIELAVAIGLLVIIMSFSGIIFRTGSEAMRVALANAEIMHKFQTITAQLDADFRGYGNHSIVVLETGGNVRVEIDGSQYNLNSDKLGVLINGDFREIIDEETYHANSAIVHYGIADLNNVTVKERENPVNQLLVRRQTILTNYVDFTGTSFDDPTEVQAFQSSISEQINSFLKNKNVVEDWNESSDLPLDADLNYARQVIAGGVYQFKIEYIGLGKPFDEWQSVDDLADIYPVALKFTFRIADSRGMITEYDQTQGANLPGRVFTHIIYLYK